MDGDADMNVGDIRSDIKVPNTNVGSEIKNLFEKGDEVVVTILSAMGRHLAIACSSGSDSCRQVDEGCVAQCSVTSENLIARSSPHINSNTSPARTVT